MHYALIHNNQIEVGPRQWHWSSFKYYLDQNQLNSSALPVKASTDPIITDEWKILPVEYEPEPAYIRPYEQLAGPFLTINETNVTGVWNVAPVDIETVKSCLKSVATENRYKAEVGGIKVTIQDNQVTVDTSREGRQIYLDTYLAIGDTETINWKFAEMWLNVNKSDIGQIVFAGKEHIQSCFTWEKQKLEEIDACVDRASLEAVELRHPLNPLPKNMEM